MTLRWIGGIVILGILAVLIIFYLRRGMVRIESGRSGRTVVRFNAFERFVHWMTATRMLRHRHDNTVRGAGACVRAILPPYWRPMPDRNKPMP